MYEEKFSGWVPWRERRVLSGTDLPGVYAIALPDDALAETAFSWHPAIIYLGMTNSATGLRGRLDRFDRTIAGKRGHGGADRVRFKHRDYITLSQRLSVAVSVFDCDVNSMRPADLRVMGSVVQFEYLCLAHFSELFGRLPEFNDRQSPKFSLTLGRAKKHRPAT